MTKPNAPTFNVAAQEPARVQAPSGGQPQETPVAATPNAPTEAVQPPEITSYRDRLWTVCAAAGLRVRQNAAAIGSDADDEIAVLKVPAQPLVCTYPRCPNTASVCTADCSRKTYEAAEKPPSAPDALDAARHRWLRDNAFSFDAIADPDNLVRVWHGTVSPPYSTSGKTLDAAIDAAMALDVTKRDPKA
jgi:hypothetical protein